MTPFLYSGGRAGLTWERVFLMVLHFVNTTLKAAGDDESLMALVVKQLIIPDFTKSGWKEL